MAPLQTGGAPLLEVPLMALAVAPGRHLVPKMAAGEAGLAFGGALYSGRFVPAFRQLLLSPRGRLHVGHFNAWVETFTLQL